MTFNFILTYGFYLSKREIINKFSYVEEGKFRFEKRFDPKTGFEVAPEKIWEVPTQTYFFFENKKIDIQNYQEYNKYSGYHKFSSPEFSFGKEYELIAQNDFELLCWLIANKKEENRKDFTFQVAFDSLNRDRVCFFVPLKNTEETCSIYEYFREDSFLACGQGKINFEDLQAQETLILELQNNLELSGFQVNKPELFIRAKKE